MDDTQPRAIVIPEREGVVPVVPPRDALAVPPRQEEAVAQPTPVAAVPPLQTLTPSASQPEPAAPVSVEPSPVPVPPPVAEPVAPSPLATPSVPKPTPPPVVAPVVPDPAPAPELATPEPLVVPEEEVVPAPEPQYSAVTPIYAPVENKAPVDAPRPVGKAIDMVAPSAPAPTPLEQAVTAPVEPTPQPIMNPMVGFSPSPGGTSSVPTVMANPGGGRNLKKIILIIIIAIVVVGGGAWAITSLISSGNSTPEVVQQDEGEETLNPESPVLPGTDSDDETGEDAETPEAETPPAFGPSQQPDAESTGRSPSTSSSTPKVANTGINDIAIPTQPRRITIPALGVNASIENVGLVGGAIGAPSSIWNAGWYTGSAHPGTSGAVFIDGHASPSGDGLFGYLSTLKVGDDITIERNDGKKVTYLVTKVAVVDRHNVDMASMLRPFAGAKRGLNLMSCAGAWIESEQTLSHRVLIYTVEK